MHDAHWCVAGTSRDVEKAERARGQRINAVQGGGLAVPLAVLSQQQLHVVRYFLKVPEPTAPDGDTVRCAQETLVAKSAVGGGWTTATTRAGFPFTMDFHPRTFGVEDNSGACMWCTCECGSDLWAQVNPSQSTGKELGNVICGWSIDIITK